MTTMTPRHARTEMTSIIPSFDQIIMHSSRPRDYLDHSTTDEHDEDQTNTPLSREDTATWVTWHPPFSAGHRRLTTHQSYRRRHRRQRRAIDDRGRPPELRRPPPRWWPDTRRLPVRGHRLPQGRHRRPRGRTTLMPATHELMTATQRRPAILGHLWTLVKTLIEHLKYYFDFIITKIH